MMHPEFKAYIHSVAGECDRQSESVLHRLAMAVVKVLAKLGSLAANLLEEFGPYYCDIGAISRVKRALRRCPTRTDAIGYHGLV